MKGLSPTNIKTELDFTVGEPTPSFTTITYWVAEFRRGRTSCQGENCSGRRNEVTTTEIIKKIRKMVLDERRLKVCDLVDMVGISKSAVYGILTENFEMRKLCARWVRRLLAMEQKQSREDVSVECSAMQ